MGLKSCASNLSERKLLWLVAGHVFGAGKKQGVGFEPVNDSVGIIMVRVFEHHSIGGIGHAEGYGAAFVLIDRRCPIGPAATAQAQFHAFDEQGIVAVDAERPA